MRYYVFFAILPLFNFLHGFPTLRELCIRALAHSPRQTVTRPMPVPEELKINIKKALINRYLLKYFSIFLARSLQKIVRENLITSIAHSPDGNVILTGYADGTLTLWDVRGNAHYKTLGKHRRHVTCSAFSEDGLFLMTGSQDGAASLFELRGNPPLRRTFYHHRPLQYVAFMPPSFGSAVVIDTHGIVYYWILAVQEPQCRIINDFCTPLFHGPYGLSRSTHKTNMFRHFTNSGCVEYVIHNFTQNITHMVVSKDGKLAVTGSSDGEVYCWNLMTDPPSRHIISKEQRAISAIALSQDKKNILVGTDSVHLWDIAALPYKQIHLADYPSAISTLVFNPDGRLAAVGLRNRVVELFDLQKEPFEKVTLKAHGCPIESIYFTANGKLLITTTAKEIFIWSLSGTAKLLSLEQLQKLVYFDSDNLCEFSDDLKEDIQKYFQMNKP